MKNTRVPATAAGTRIEWMRPLEMRRNVGSLSFLTTLIAIFTIGLSTTALSSSEAEAEAETEAQANTKAAASKEDSAAVYTVKDGNKVDANTLAGWKTWRALACERCHGAAQEGMVGPSLIDSLKVLTKQEFHDTIMNGRIEKGMPPFNTSAMMQKNWEGLYAYLKGRSDGKIKPGRLSAIEP